MIEARVPNLLKFPVPDDPERPGLRRLNQNALELGWRRALEERFSAGAGGNRYVTDPTRARFVDLLPLTRESVILEVGSSLGQITTILAERAGFVHGLEIELEQAEFAAERCRQEGLSNVSLVCGGDDCRLPYEDGMFDGVVINLVLEWCGSRDAATPFVESQQRMLRESARVLKPGGWLYLATKNRFSLAILVGKPDEHTFSWRFGQALPRWLLALLLRLRGKPRPPGLLHSHRALGRMLRDAGFTDLKRFWSVPEFRFPTAIVPADARSVREARRRPGLVQGPIRTTRLLMPLVPAPLVKHVTPDLTFLARKAP